MSRLPRVVHLVDDATAGGVMRVIDHLLTSPDLATQANHSLIHLARGKISARVYEADLIVSHLSISWRNLPMLIAAGASNASTPFVHVEHSYTEAFVALNVKHRARFTALLKTAFSLFDRVVAVSNEQSAWIARRGFCRADKVVAIQSCVDLSAFRAMPAPSGKPYVFGAIGRLDTQKGFDTLIKAFRARKRNDVELHIFGEGAEEVNLRNQAAGDDAIVFKGYANNAQAAFADVDTVLMPSRWEAYGLVAIEALSAGRQLFCANTDGMRDHACGGATLITGGSISLWAEVINGNIAPNHLLSNEVNYRTDDILERNFAFSWNSLVSELVSAG